MSNSGMELKSAYNSSEGQKEDYQENHIEWILAGISFWKTLYKNKDQN